jgi:hypothetical protein
LGVFAKFWEVTNSFVISVCMPVHPHGITQLPLERFLRKFYTGDFPSNMTKKIHACPIPEKNIGHIA